jgi:putative flippase GtrA
MTVDRQGMDGHTANTVDRDRGGSQKAGEVTAPAPGSACPPVLDLALPVYNEQEHLERSVRTLHALLSRHVSYPFRITIADNASTDATSMIAAALASELPEVVSVRLEQKGRGRALRRVWSSSDAVLLAYCDIDLSTDMAALPALLAPLASAHSELSIGTRLAYGSSVVRGAKREFISRCYNLVLRTALGVRFSDAQCGFKAIRADVAREILPLIEDNCWFFDTELLVLAERAGLRIHEVPVDWVEDPHSSVDIKATALADLRGVWRVGWALSTGAVQLDPLRQRFGRSRGAPAPAALGARVRRFALVGLLSTCVQLLLFLLLRGPFGAIPANAVALLLATVANTAANRHFTFGLRGRARAARHQAQGFLLLALGLGLSSGTLTGVHALWPHAGTTGQLAALVLANAAVTTTKFLLFHTWIFRGPRPARHDGAMLEPPGGVGVPLPRSQLARPLR